MEIVIAINGTVPLVGLINGRNVNDVKQSVIHTGSTLSMRVLVMMMMRAKMKTMITKGHITVIDVKNAKSSEGYAFLTSIMPFKPVGPVAPVSPVGPSVLETKLDQVDYCQQKSKSLGELVMRTLETLEARGGEDAFINIKYLVPTYQSVNTY